jgi:hypothetical protein
LHRLQAEVLAGWLVVLIGNLAYLAECGCILQLEAHYDLKYGDKDSATPHPCRVGKAAHLQA